MEEGGRTERARGWDGKSTIKCCLLGTTQQGNHEHTAAVTTSTRSEQKQKGLTVGGEPVGKKVASRTGWAEDNGKGNTTTHNTQVRSYQNYKTRGR